MDITDKIDDILLDEGLKALAKNTVVSVLVAIAVLVGAGSPVKVAVEKAHKQHSIADMSTDQLEKLYKSVSKSK